MSLNYKTNRIEKEMVFCYELLRNVISLKFCSNKFSSGGIFPENPNEISHIHSNQLDSN